MTTKEAVSIIQRQMRSIIFELMKDNDREMAQTVDTAWITVREAALEWTCNTENRPLDEGKTDKGMFIPESPNPGQKATFEERTERCDLITETARRAAQNETDIMMLWDAVEAIKERLPREWK